MKVFIACALIIGSLIGLNSCSDRNTADSDCGDAVIIEDYNLDDIIETEMRVISMEVNGDCLTIEYASGGCDGDTWTTNVYSRLAYSKTSPPERYALFELIDNEECEAFITKTSEFDMTTMQVEGEHSIRIVFENYEEVLTYNY